MAKPNVKKVVRKNKPDNFSRRSFVLLAVQMGVIGVLAWRMRQLQIEDSDRYRLLAEENRINTRLIPPIRGLIFDKNGKMKEQPQGSSENQFRSKTDAFRVSYGHFESPFSLFSLTK